MWHPDLPGVLTVESLRFLLGYRSDWDVSFSACMSVKTLTHLRLVRRGRSSPFGMRIDGVGTANLV